MLWTKGVTPVQIMSNLNSLKTSVVNWSICIENEGLTLEIAGQYEVILIFLSFFFFFFFFMYKKSKYGSR